MPEQKPLQCNGCTLCCQRDSRKDSLVRHIGVCEDEMGHILHEKGRSPSGYIIALKGNGECWYLTSAGCSIYDTRPFYCQRFDCRELSLKFSRAEARERASRYGKLLYRVWQKGRNLLMEEKNGN